MLKNNDVIVDSIEVNIVYQIVPFGEGDFQAPGFEVTKETLTFVELQVGEPWQMELPKV